jgi:cytochrome c
MAAQGLNRRIVMRCLSVTLLLALAAWPCASAAQDAATGEKTYAKCRPCHQLGENAKAFAGPPLNGLFGRKAGTIPGFSYSPANKNSGITWDEATFSDYIKDPRAKMPGTKMVFPGLKDEKEIQDIIAYLKQFGPDGKKS